MIAFASSAPARMLAGMGGRSSSDRNAAICSQSTDGLLTR